MEIRYRGLAPTPDQLRKIMEGNIDQDEAERGDISRYEIRNEDFPDGAPTDITPTFRSEVTQIIYSTHWEYQKRVLDHVEAVIASDRQWAIVRKILMGVMTEQVERTRLLVGQRIRQEMLEAKDGDNE